MMTLAAVMCLSHNPTVMASFAKLRQPEYFPNILGVARLLGVVTLPAPGFSLLKEWACAGFTITFVSAFISHLVSSDAGHALPAAIAAGPPRGVLLPATAFPPPARLAAHAVADAC